MQTGVCPCLQKGERMNRNSIKGSYTEFGILETLDVLKKHLFDKEIIFECNKYIPIPTSDSFTDVESIKGALEALGKERLLLLTPEIALIKEFTEKSCVKDIFVCLPSDMEDEVVERIYNNSPKNTDVKFIKEYEIGLLRPFKPDNAAIIAFGFADNDNALIPDYNYRMLKYYDSFFGKKVLVSCGENVSNERPSGWMPIKTFEYFNDVI